MTSSLGGTVVATDRITVLRQVRERFDEEPLSGLARSIKEVGVQQPLLVRARGLDLVLVDGERRLRAAKMAGLESVPVLILEEDLSDADVVQQQLIANIQRENLTAYEKARGIDRLMRVAGWTASQAATRLGLSVASVSRLLALLTLPESIRTKVELGAIPASAAYELSHVADPGTQAELALRVEAGELTRDSIRKAATKRRRTHKPKASRVTTMVAKGFSVTVKPSLVTLDALIGSLEVLVALAREAKPRGTDVTGFLKNFKAGVHA